MHNALPSFAVQADNALDRRACLAWVFTDTTPPDGFETYDVVAGPLRWEADDPFMIDYIPGGNPVGLSDGVSSIDAPYHLGPEIAVCGGETGPFKCIWTDKDVYQPGIWDLGVYGDTNELF
jgi:hypothetical protein